MRTFTEDEWMLTAEGKDAKVELTESLVKITHYKKSKIENVEEIPRDSVLCARAISKDEFRIYVPNEHNPRLESYYLIYFKPEQTENFEKIAEEIGHGPWYEDKRKLSHTESYESEEQASIEANKAAKTGWRTQSTTTKTGQIFRGSSTSKGEIIITYERTPAWLASNNKAVSQPSVTTSASLSADDLLQKLKQLKGMLDADLISQSEYDAKKAELLSRM
jgi:hypothetical protein